MTVDHAPEGVKSPTGCPVSGMAAGFDPFQGAYQVDPSSSLRDARKEEPVFYSPLLDYWVVTRYEDIKQIFKTPSVFSPSITLDQITPISDEALQILGSYQFAPGPTIVNEDEPIHTERRRLLLQPFEAENVATLEPKIREVVNTYLDRVIKDGRADLIGDLLYEVPCIVALIFLGVPDEDIETCRHFGMQQTLFTWGHPRRRTNSSRYRDGEVLGIRRRPGRQTQGRPECEGVDPPCDRDAAAAPRPLRRQLPAEHHDEWCGGRARNHHQRHR